MTLNVSFGLQAVDFTTLQPTFFFLPIQSGDGDFLIKAKLGSPPTITFKPLCFYLEQTRVKDILKMITSVMINCYSYGPTYMMIT